MDAARVGELVRESVRLIEKHCPDDHEAIHAGRENLRRLEEIEAQAPAIRARYEAAMAAAIEAKRAREAAGE